MIATITFSNIHSYKFLFSSNKNFEDLPSLQFSNMQHLLLSYCHHVVCPSPMTGGHNNCNNCCRDPDSCCALRWLLPLLQARPPSLRVVLPPSGSNESFFWGQSRRRDQAKWFPGNTLLSHC